MKILKKTYSKNNNEIVLIENNSLNAVGLESPTYSGETISSHKNKTILIIGIVHGDEPQGKFLIENYLSLQGESQSNSKNKLLFIPCLNPDGFDLKTRENANGVDLNRNFHTESPEIETVFVKEIIEEFKPDIILTLHAPYKVVNYDGPAEKIAQDISEIIGYPTSNDIGYPTPGSMGTYAGIERKIPIITLELDEEIDVNELIAPVNKIFNYLANT